MAQVAIPSERNTVRQVNRNTLNALDGADWLRFTKTWFILNPGVRLRKQIHPATFPTALAEQFIRFFTKPGDWIVDPFLGAGSTAIASKLTNRNCVGIELYAEYAKAAKKWTEEVEGRSSTVILRGDSRKLLPTLAENGIPQPGFCITSPPYWSQLSAPAETSERNEERSKRGLSTDYGGSRHDLGNIVDYEEFLAEQGKVFDALFDIMRDKSYLVVVTNNVYHEGRLYPLAFDTFRNLSRRWVPKDERIWCQDDRKLRPFGMFHSYIGNRSHHYCLVFRKVLKTVPR